MESVHESAPAAKILVGVSLDARASSQLLSWAVTVAARPNDTVIALHVLVRKAEKRLKSERSSLRQAQASVISAVGEFAGVCQTKRVTLEAKVRTCSSVGEGLADEAALVEANLLVLRRNSFEIVRYCLKNAPEGCSIVGVDVDVDVDVDVQALPRKDGDVDSLTYDDNNSSSSSRLTYKDNNNNMVNALSPLRKFFGSTSKRDRRHSSSESICEKESPRGVLEGPEAASTPADDCSSSSSSVIGRRSHTNNWRRLSVARLFFPLPPSPEDSISMEGDACSSYAEEVKPSWTCFSYEEISRATNKFHPDNLVGRGGFAEVFKGSLRSGQNVAVKRLAKGEGDQLKEKEFLVELGILGHVRHPNTAYLIGCCIENGLHLVFDLSCNGSLASALHSKHGRVLEWSARYKIAIGIARGLHYLHKCCRHRIIHRDIKASNVVLGADFEPQISDFGLAKWLPKQWTHHSVIPIEGTLGYLAPEYFMHGIVDEKTDVFSFGVLLLEIVTGRRPADTSKQSLLVWAKPLMQSGRIAELADPKLEGKYDMDQMQRLVVTASYCVRQSSIWRPPMSKVLGLLTNDRDSVEAQIRSIPECQVDEMDDYNLATDCSLDY
ncbi:probable receptor-like serine/threonine-protein kinase At5g57670 isoform X2 [Musa acuminata AAA Group]|uniref:probable receptor-like serine/threonine-protein kinase At5g57670 isoform X2 n=1 Tax=Musa acuminata AAA Group TaxID=214697 RepID=UPI0031E31207